MVCDWSKTIMPSNQITVSANQVSAVVNSLDTTEMSDIIGVIVIFWPIRLQLIDKLVQNNMAIDF